MPWRLAKPCHQLCGAKHTDQSPGVMVSAHHSICKSPCHSVSHPARCFQGSRIIAERQAVQCGAGPLRQAAAAPPFSPLSGICHHFSLQSRPAVGVPLLIDFRRAFPRPINRRVSGRRWQTERSISMSTSFARRRCAAWLLPPWPHPPWLPWPMPTLPPCCASRPSPMKHRPSCSASSSPWANTSRRPRA